MKQQIAFPGVIRRQQFTIPLIVAMAVFLVPTTLIVVALHSPYTHANLLTYFDSSYTRTPQSEVGAPLLYSPPALAAQSDPTASQSLTRSLLGSLGLYRPADQAAQVDATAPIEDRGKAIFVARGCAGCHGTDGKGSSVGPQLVTDIEVIRQMVRTGPGRMPAFSPQVVTDYDMTAIAAYLKSVNH